MAKPAPQPGQDPDPPKRREPLPRIVLAIAVVALFGRVVTHPFVVYDDVKYILTNRLVVAPGDAPLLDLLLTPTAGYIVPVTVLFEALLFAIGGGEPWIFHAASLALHVSMALMVFGFARKLGASALAATAASLLFALHPVVVEPVAWATGIKDLISANLAMGASWCFVVAVSRLEAGEPARRAIAGAASLGILAALAKPTAVLLASAWLITLGARALDKKSTPGPAVGLAFGVLGAGGLLGLMSRFSHDTLLVEDVARAGEGQWQSLMALGIQTHHLFWPDSLHPIYNIDRTLGFADWHTWLGCAVLLLVAVAALLLRKHPRALFCLALAAVVYLPVSSVLPFPRFVADSYLYFPLAALALLTALALTRALPDEMSSTGKAGAMVALGVCLVLVAALGWRTHTQITRWEGGPALWQPLIDDNPDWPFGYTSLAQSHHVLKKDSASAVEQFHRAFKVGYDTDALPNYGVSLARLGRLHDAECVMIEAVHHSGLRDSALRNLAVFHAANPDRAPAFPDQASALLHPLALQVEAGTLPWPQTLRAGLKTQVDRLKVIDKVPPWPLRGCDVLK